MAKRTIDPGLGQRLTGRVGKLITEDGNFNVRRINAPLSSHNPYTFLVNISWGKFFMFITSGFIVVNLFFTLLYLLNGVEQLNGIDKSSSWMMLLANTFFFSVHTLTTVGYGNVAPIGFAANIISVIEIFIGVLYVALITGLLYGRFSKPSSHVLYSKNLLIAPYQDKTAVMFRLSNARNSHITNVDIEVWLTYLHIVHGNPADRRYVKLKLERDDITFFTFTWTIVHPIDENSPFHNKSLDELKMMDTQVFSIMKGFDHTFSQQVTSLNSYVVDDIVWGAKFEMAYYIAQDEVVEVFLDRLDLFSKVELPELRGKAQSDTSISL
jgi:inward rectifier potassium channel